MVESETGPYRSCRQKRGDVARRDSSAHQIERSQQRIDPPVGQRCGARDDPVVEDVAGRTERGANRRGETVDVGADDGDVPLGEGVIVGEQMEDLVAGHLRLPRGAGTGMERDALSDPRRVCRGGAGVGLDVGMENPECRPARVVRNARPGAFACRRRGARPQQHRSLPCRGAPRDRQRMVGQHRERLGHLGGGTDPVAAAQFDARPGDARRRRQPQDLDGPTDREGGDDVEEVGSGVVESGHEQPVRQSAGPLIGRTVTKGVDGPGEPGHGVGHERGVVTVALDPETDAVPQVVLPSIPVGEGPAPAVESPPLGPGRDHLVAAVVIAVEEPGDPSGSYEAGFDPEGAELRQHEKLQAVDMPRVDGVATRRACDRPTQFGGEGERDVGGDPVGSAR